MRGRPGCPTEQEKKPVGATVSNPLFYKERLGTGSPPHPPQRAHWGTYGLWWLRLYLTEQSPGLFDPRGEGFGGGKDPSRLRNPPFPARPAGGRAVTGVRYRAAGQAEKREDPLQGPKNQSRESRGEKLSPLALFPPVSREKRGPPPGRRPTGRCAPRPRKSPTHPQGTQYRPPRPPAPLGGHRDAAPQKINLQTSIFNSIIKSR